jgi:hypothetical protein
MYKCSTSVLTQILTVFSLNRQALKALLGPLSLLWIGPSGPQPFLITRSPWYSYFDIGQPSATGAELATAQPQDSTGSSRSNVSNRSIPKQRAKCRFFTSQKGKSFSCHIFPYCLRLPVTIRHVWVWLLSSGKLYLELLARVLAVRGTVACEIGKQIRLVL